MIVTIAKDISSEEKFNFVFSTEWPNDSHNLIVEFITSLTPLCISISGVSIRPIFRLPGSILICSKKLFS